MSLQNLEPKTDAPRRDEAETPRRELRSRDGLRRALAFVYSDASLDADHYVENFTAGRGAE